MRLAELFNEKAEQYDDGTSACNQARYNEGAMELIAWETHMFTLRKAERLVQPWFDYV